MEVPAPLPGPTYAPAQTITEAYNAVNPDQALQPGDPRYVDFTEWRGDDHLVRLIKRRIERADALPLQDVQHLKQLVAGHRGCGKSTELLRLQRFLENDDYFVVYFNSALEVDMNDVEYSDVLLAMLHALVLRATEEDLRINPDLLDSIALRLGRKVLEREEREEIERTLEGEFRAEAELPLFFKVMAAVKEVTRSGSMLKTKVRAAVQQRPAQFLEDINDVVDNLQHQLRGADRKSLVVVIDSLDRIIPHERAGGRTTHSEIFLEHAAHLKAPRCHMVYTVPISIFFNANISTVYPDRPEVLSMIKVREPSDAVCDGGLNCMEEAIRKRLDVGALFEEPEDVRELCLLSGGHVRDLLRLHRYACDSSDDIITPRAVERASQALVRDYDRLVKDEDLPRLVKIHREKRLPSDEAYAFLPYHLLVLEYQNGERWADVHPAVQRTRKFQRALEEDAHVEPATG